MYAAAEARRNVRSTVGAPGCAMIAGRGARCSEPGRGPSPYARGADRGRGPGARVGRIPRRAGPARFALLGGAAGPRRPRDGAARPGSRRRPAAPDPRGLERLVGALVALHLRPAVLPIHWGVDTWPMLARGWQIVILAALSGLVLLAPRWGAVAMDLSRSRPDMTGQRRPMSRAALAAAIGALTVGLACRRPARTPSCSASRPRRPDGCG